MKKHNVTGCRGRMLLLAAALMGGGSLMAQHVSEDAARAKALQFLSTSVEQHLRKAPRRAPQLRAAVVTDEYYIFNDAGNAGYVIVSGEEGTEAILGYSDEGTFDATRLPENMQDWLDGYAEQIRAVAASGGGAPGGAAAGRAGAAYVSIAPLLKTQWGQGAPYNRACPLDGNTQCVTGCLPTVMAQVMYYYRWPETVSQDIPALYDDEEERVIVAESPFDYDRMLTTYTTGAYSDEQADAVAFMMRACGQAAKATYNAAETVTNWGMDLMAMKKYFRYNPDATIVSRFDYTEAEWEALIYHELSERRPVPYRGNRVNTNVGHQFLCDGYSGNRYFHINWGWGGSNDGYFLLSLQAGATNTRYSENQAATIGLQPDKYGVCVPAVESDVMFEEATSEGVKVKYHILDEEAKTVQVGSGNTQAVDLLAAGKVTIPAEVRGYTVVNVGQWAFMRCEEMTDVVLPATVTGIDMEGFWGCTSLQSAVLSDAITSIGDYAFSNCPMLAKANIPQALQTLGTGPFWGCWQLTGELALPELLTTIGDDAFFNNGYTSVVIPPSVKKMGKEAFAYCMSLEKLTIMPGLLTTLPESAFGQCYNLAEVSLPEGLKMILKEAFNGCEQLKAVTLPSTLLAIRAGAFAGCTSLETVESRIEAPMVISADAFADSYETALLSVPAGTKSLYQAKAGWRNFLHIEEREATGVEPLLSGTEKDGAAEYFDLQGRRLAAPGRGLLLKRRTNGVVEKVLMR